MQNKILNFNFYLRRKGGYNMCKILKNIQGRTADELLEIYAISYEPPIDIDKLVFNVGISIIPMDFSLIEQKANVPKGYILGATISQNDTVNILYRENNTENRRRFTIAHEIAHCCLHTDNLIDHHIELRDSYKSNSGKEYEANIFAGELLIPEKSLHNVYTRLIVPSLDALAKIFNVSSTVMVARLDYLKLPYFKDVEINEA